MSKEVYIVDGIRSAIGNFGGTLAPVRCDDLAAHVIKALMERNKNVDPNLVEDLIFGCANQAGEDNRNVARMSSLLAGLPWTMGGETVNRLCASGMASTINASRAIKDGAGDRFNQLELEIGAYTTIVTDQQQPTAAAMGEALGMSAEDILSHPHCLIGSENFICEQLEQRRERYGISYITVMDDGENNMVDAFAPIVARLAGK